MTPLQRQIAASHNELIRLVLASNRDAQTIPVLEALLDDMHTNGWEALTLTLRQRIQPAAECKDIPPLDDEDHAILQIIEYFGQNPQHLDALGAHDAEQNVQFAAQALAAVIYAATQGEREALEALAELHQAADTPAALATSAALIAIIEGERDADKLSQNLPTEQRMLIGAVLTELYKLEA
jgi:hypothetical protein